MKYNTVEERLVWMLRNSFHSNHNHHVIIVPISLVGCGVVQFQTLVEAGYLVEFKKNSFIAWHIVLSESGKEIQRFLEL